MKNIRNSYKQIFLTLALVAAPLAAVQMHGTEALAQSSYFTSRGCVNCHSTPVVATCNGCHHHGSSPLSASVNKASYAPGETVTATLAGGSRSGWIGARLYNQSGVEVARSSGSQSGMGGSTVFPAVLSAPAPATAGTYTWKMAYFGNADGTGTGDVHSEISVNVSITVAAAADIVAPVVSFTLPATATSLTVPVSSLSATDNVAVTGYLVNKSATIPAATAAGWTAAAPTSVTAVAGSNTFYAWAKDAAGNVSAVKSATVTVTVIVADAVKPVVSAFTLPATATNLTIVVSAFTATDNVAVTGYLITTSSAAPAASAAGWSAASPVTVIAAAGVNTFYAWAKDAAGNVSAGKSASVTVTMPVLDTVAPVVGVFTLPATSTSLTVAVSAFTASDNVGVTGYLITKTSATPLATAVWNASAPATVTAVAGANTFYAWAKDAAGNVSLSKSASVTIATATDITKPTLTISSLATGSYTNTATLNVSGTATDAGGLKSVTVDGQVVTVNADGSFSFAVTLDAGVNTITTIATDNAGNQQADIRTVTYDANAPVLTVSGPADNSTTTQSFVTVTGTISETSAVTISNNNGAVQTAAIAGNTYSAIVYLAPGVNTITINATDLAGNTTAAKRTVTYEAAASSLTLAVTDPNQDITTSDSKLTLRGTVVGSSSNVKVVITMDGKSFSPEVANGAFKQKLTFTKAKLYAITITATDAAGNSSTIVRNVIYAPTHNDHDDKNHHEKNQQDKKQHEDRNDKEHNQND